MVVVGKKRGGRDFKDPNLATLSSIQILKNVATVFDIFLHIFCKRVLIENSSKYTKFREISGISCNLSDISDIFVSVNTLINKPIALKCLLASSS